MDITEKERTKESKTGKVIALIMVIIAVTAASFAIGLKVGELKPLETTKNNQKTEPQKEQSQSQEISISGIDEIENTIEMLDGVLDLGKIEDTSKISDEKLFDFATLNLKTSAEGIYKLDDINEFLNKTLGQTIKKPQNFDVTFVVCDYKTEKKEFECYGHGGEIYKSFNRITSIKVTGDIYTVEVKKAINTIADVGFDTNPFYKNIDDLNAKKNPIFKAELQQDDQCGDSLQITTIELFAMTPNDKLGTYTYTFQKVDTNYILKSMTY